jgi:CRISPR type III-B/RAMP module RAMP protein Cmr6
MKVLIAPWGNPLGWEEVEYGYNGEKQKSKGPLPLIKRVENLDKIIIVSVNTLVNNFIYSLEELYYSDVKTLCENLILNLCQNEFKFEPDKVIVSYGFGEFSKMKFSGNAMDFYYDVFKKLAFCFAKLGGKIEVIFDATHGINYITILTYRVLREILEILPSDKNDILKHKLLFGAQNFKGLLIFLDAYPEINENQQIFELDVMTPHYQGYYTKNQPPGDWENPNPITFLTVKKEINFCFNVLFDRFRAKEILNDDKFSELSQLVKDWLEKALKEFGVGAKTRLGYGIFEE